MPETLAPLDKADIERGLNALNPRQRQELVELLGIDVLWRPLPGPQTTAYHSEANVIGYGGAAGAGKTHLAIGKALMQHRQVAIMRRESTQLLGIDNAIADLLGTRQGRNKNGWRISPVIHPRARRPVNIEFGSIQHLGDEEKHRGRDKDLLVLDEAAQFMLYMVTFVIGWVRTVRTDVRAQTLLTFNPPTDNDGIWVFDYFGPWLDPKHKNPAQFGELRWFSTYKGEDIELQPGQIIKDERGNVIVPQSRTFIPGRIRDNAYLTGTGYEAQLQAMPEPLRSQMLYGDFLVGLSDHAYQVIPTAWVQAAMDRWTDRSPKGPMDSMGVDVARGGKDDTILGRRHGRWFDVPIVEPGKKTPDGNAVVGLVISNRRGRAPIHLDVIGVGASPYDLLKNAGQHVIGVNHAHKPTGRDRAGVLRFANQRAQDVWRMRDALDPQYDQGIMLPPDKNLLADLTAYRWRMQGVRVYIESREEIIKRTGRSPDYGTAYILALRDTPVIPLHDEDDDDGDGRYPY